MLSGSFFYCSKGDGIHSNGNLCLDQVISIGVLDHQVNPRITGWRHFYLTLKITLSYIVSYEVITDLNPG